MSVIPPNKNLKAERSRERILDTAAQLFRDKGYASVSLRAIASEAGMKAGSLYYHFDSKEEIITEVLNIGVARVHQAVESAIVKLPDTASADTLIRTGINSHLRALFEYSAYTSANVRIFGQVPAEIQKANLTLRHNYEDLWLGILNRAKDQGRISPAVDLSTFRLLLIGSLNATLEWFDPKNKKVSELADEYAVILLGGLLEKSDINY